VAWAPSVEARGSDGSETGCGEARKGAARPWAAMASCGGVHARGRVRSWRPLARGGGTAALSKEVTSRSGAHTTSQARRSTAAASVGAHPDGSRGRTGGKGRVRVGGLRGALGRGRPGEGARRPGERARRPGERAPAGPEAEARAAGAAWRT
jgi:hypothetical protein